MSFDEQVGSCERLEDLWVAALAVRECTPAYPSLEELQFFLKRGVKRPDRPTVIVIDTDPTHGPGEAGGGHWWDITVPEVGRTEMLAVARLRYKEQQARQSLVN